MSAPPNILDLIQKLLRLADTSRGATEHEAESALAKAEELMVRHKIDSAMLRMSHGSEDLPGIAIQKEAINLPKTINPADMLILSLLQSHFNVRIVLFKNSQATPVDIIGTWEDVQFAIHVFHFLRETFSRCWNEFKVSASTPDRKSFYRGLHDGLRSAILEGKKRAEAAASTEERSRYQIVMVDTAAAIDRYMGERYGQLRKRRSRNSRVYSESYQAGRAKGGTITINRTLPGSAGECRLISSAASGIRSPLILIGWFTNAVPLIHISNPETLPAHSRQLLAERPDQFDGGFLLRPLF